MPTQQKPLEKAREVWYIRGMKETNDKHEHDDLISPEPSATPDLRPHLRDFTLPKLQDFLALWGEKRFRAEQVFRFSHDKLVDDPAQMTNLAKPLRERLSRELDCAAPALVDVAESRDGTRKLVFELTDAARVEAVLIPSDKHLTLCLSTQVGCQMGCAFCFTAGLGFQRNLRVYEMVDQYRVAARMARDEMDGRRLSNLVFMGMGEPMLNLDNLIDTLDILQDERGMMLSNRKITVSTCGILPKIPEFTERSSVMLAVSLNATTDEVRSRLMPINRKYPLADLVQTLKALPHARRVRTVLEYVLLDGVNNTEDDVRRLAAIAREVQAKVNLLAFNIHEKSDFQRPSDQAVKAFQDKLLSRGVQAMIRSSRGEDAHAACGMLGKTNHPKGEAV